MTASLHFEGWAAALATDIDQAQRVISMSALSLLPPRRMDGSPIAVLYSAMIAAAARGVAVRMLLPSPTLSHPATGRNKMAAQRLKDDGIACQLLNAARLLHAKTVMLDHQIAWVGSGNLTAAAAAHNREAWTRIRDDRSADTLAAWHAEMAVEATESW